MAAVRGAYTRIIRRVWLLLGCFVKVREVLRRVVMSCSVYSAEAFQNHRQAQEATHGTSSNNFCGSLFRQASYGLLILTRGFS